MMIDQYFKSAESQIIELKALGIIKIAKYEFDVAMVTGWNGMNCTHKIW